MVTPPGVCSVGVACARASIAASHNEQSVLAGLGCRRGAGDFPEESAVVRGAGRPAPCYGVASLESLKACRRVPGRRRAGVTGAGCGAGSLAIRAVC